MSITRRNLFGALALAATPVPPKPRWKPPDGASEIEGLGWRVAKINNPGGCLGLVDDEFLFGSGPAMSVTYEIFDYSGKLLG